MRGCVRGLACAATVVACSLTSARARGCRCGWCDRGRPSRGRLGLAAPGGGAACARPWRRGTQDSGVINRTASRVAAWHAAARRGGGGRPAPPRRRPDGVGETRGRREGTRSRGLFSSALVLAQEAAQRDPQSPEPLALEGNRSPTSGVLQRRLPRSQPRSNARLGTGRSSPTGRPRVYGSAMPTRRGCSFAALSRSTRASRGCSSLRRR